MRSNVKCTNGENIDERRRYTIKYLIIIEKFIEEKSE